MKRNIPFNIALKLKNIGFDDPCISFYLGDEKKNFLNTKVGLSPENHNYLPTRVSAPTIGEVVEWFDDRGYYIDVTPEFYEEGVNWNIQLFWILPFGERKPEEFSHLSFQERAMGGTAKYGDNNEYPRRSEAYLAGIEKAIKNFKQ